MRSLRAQSGVVESPSLDAFDGANAQKRPAYDAHAPFGPTRTSSPAASFPALGSPCAIHKYAAAPMHTTPTPSAMSPSRRCCLMASTSDWSQLGSHFLLSRSLSLLARVRAGRPHSAPGRRGASTALANVRAPEPLAADLHGKLALLENAPCELVRL